MQFYESMAEFALKYLIAGLIVGICVKLLGYLVSIMTRATDT